MKNLLPHFVEKAFQEGRFKGRFNGYVVFVDLSGFTPLTETLMRKGSRGAEELSLILNDIFSPLVRQVYARGGFIPYFAGDAFTAIFPEEQDQKNINVVLDTALGVSTLFKQKGFTFRGFKIGIKVGISYGAIDWGIVGRNYKSFYFRGTPIHECTHGFKGKGNQDIIVHEKFFQCCKDCDNISFESLGDDYYSLIFDYDTSNLLDLPAVSLEPLSEQVAGLFLPAEVIKFNFEGEFRTVISVFISFKGVENHDALEQFAGVVIDQMLDFSGYFKEIEFGDKGGVMVGFFGAPVSFENSVERALEFITGIREILEELQSASALKFRAGITIGKAYTGIVGGEERCQYAAVGNRVNLAARLMMHADWDEVLVDREIQKNKQFRFEHRGDISYKGIKGNIPTYRLLGRDYETRTVFDGKMVGRNRELTQLFDFTSKIFLGKSSGVSFVFGEAGIGKSRLTHELRTGLEGTKPLRWMTCQADQILKKPFNPFIYLLKNYFEQSANSPTLTQYYNFENKYQELIEHLYETAGPQTELTLRELLRTKSVLAALLGLSYKHSLWEQLDDKGRYQNTLVAIVHLFLAESLIQPVVIELEDGHWLDASSKEVLRELTRQMASFPISLIITSRYLDDGSKPEIFPPNHLEQLELGILEINLNILQPEAAQEFAEFKLGGKINDDFHALLQRTTNGNPFYLEQILEYFSESDLLELEDGEWNIRDKSIRLSSSINAILTARIDRLSGLVKETVKAAAVIGREFEIPVLSEVMKDQSSFQTKNEGGGKALLNEQVKIAERGQIWRARNELRYIFRHSLLREAAYSMQLRKRLQYLHRLIAEAIERIYRDKMEERFVDLAFHFEQAGVFDKTCEYLRKAADYARSNYQVEQALAFYEKLLVMLQSQEDEITHIQTNLKKGKVLEIIGKWEESADAYHTALRIAKNSRDVVMIATANNYIGHLQMLQGNYPDARHSLEQAITLFESVEHKDGIVNVYGDLGNLNFRLGNYEEAKSFFQQSIDLAESQGQKKFNPQIIANLALTHMNQGNYEAGIRTIAGQLMLFQEATDKQGLATLYTNLGIVYFEKGDYDEALEVYQKGLKLSEELGDRLLMSIAIGSIGSVYERKGDYGRAMEHFLEDLRISEDLGDKQGTAIALGLIGELLSYQGDYYKAIEHLQKNLMICEEIGYQKGKAKALNTLGDVFYYLEDYNRSIDFYNRAIQVTRGIGNKLVLGFSLMEKGAVLIAMGNQQEELNQTAQEALELSQALGNPDLLVESELLLARKQIHEGQADEAEKSLKNILSQDINEEQEASVYFELSRLRSDDRSFKEKALQLFEKLYEETPKYSFKRRIEDLRGAS